MFQNYFVDGTLLIADNQMTWTALLNHSYKYGDEGGFTMRAQSNDGFLPYTKSNATDSEGKKRTFELENGKGYIQRLFYRQQLLPLPSCSILASFNHLGTILIAKTGSIHALYVWVDVDIYL